MSGEDAEDRRGRDAAAQAVEREIADLEERLRAHGETPAAATASAGPAGLAALRERRRSLREQLARARSRPRPADDAAAAGSAGGASNPVGAVPPGARRPGRWALLALVSACLLAGWLIREHLPPPPPVPVSGLRLSLSFDEPAGAGELDASGVGVAAATAGHGVAGRRAEPDASGAGGHARRAAGAGGDAGQGVHAAAAWRVALAVSLARVPGIDLVAAAPGPHTLPVLAAAARADLRLTVAPDPSGAGWRLTLAPDDGTTPVWRQTLTRAAGEDDAAFAGRAATAVANAAREAGFAPP